MQNIELKHATTQDATAWDNYLVKSPDKNYYNFDFIESVLHVCHLTALRIIAQDGSGTIRGLLFAYHRKGNSTKLFIPKFGLMFDGEDSRNSLMAFIEQYVNEQRLTGARVELDDGAPLPQSKNWRTLTKLTFQISLKDEINTIWNSLSSSARNKVRKSVKGEISVRQGEQYFNDFYSIYSLNCVNKKLSIRKKAYLTLLIKRTMGDVKLFVCIKDDKVLSGAIFVRVGCRVYYLFNSSLPDFLPLGINDRLIWEAIKYYKADGASMIDLGESRSGSGAYNFKHKQLKATSTPVHYVSLERKGKEKNIMRKIRPYLVEQICRQRFLPRSIIRHFLILRGLDAAFL